MVTRLFKKNSSSIITEKESSWCTVSIDEFSLKAKIIHIGRGKFKILGDEKEGKYIDRIVDASDVFHCEIETKQ
jgi:hypothetical protein